MSLALRGPWKQQQVDDFLTAGRFPLRLACMAADGYPRIVSLWYRYQQGHFYCVTHKSSQMARLLSSNGHVGFEVSPNEPPYLGVRGQGMATLTPLGDNALLGDLLEHYLGDAQSDLAAWLLARGEEELLINIQANRFFSWDYRARMTQSA